MIDSIGSVAVMTSLLVGLFLVVAAARVSMRARIVTLCVAAVWLGLALHASVVGATAAAPSDGLPVVAVLCATPVMATLLGLVVWRQFREALLSISMAVLVAVNASRFVGAMFLVLQAQGRLAGPFPTSAGWGDILVASLAIPVAIAVKRGTPRARSAITAWNALGALDLVAAVAFGVTSANGSPLQLIHAGIGSQAVQYLPYSLIPTFLVPFYLITHVAIAAQLWATRTTRPLTRVAVAPSY